MIHIRAFIITLTLISTSAWGHGDDSQFQTPTADNPNTTISGAFGSGGTLGNGAQSRIGAGSDNTGNFGLPGMGSGVGLPTLSFSGGGGNAVPSTPSIPSFAAAPAVTVLLHPIGKATGPELPINWQIPMSGPLRQRLYAPAGQTSYR